MTKYTKIDDAHPGYSVIYEVGEDGSYYSRSQWPDGIVTSQYRTTIFKMGWKSLDEFLREKGRKFARVEC